MGNTILGYCCKYEPKKAMKTYSSPPPKKKWKMKTFSLMHDAGFFSNPTGAHVGIGERQVLWPSQTDRNPPPPRKNEKKKR